MNKEERREAERLIWQRRDLDELLQHVDVATWCWSVKCATKKGHSCRVAWREAFDELVEAFKKYQVKASNLTVVIDE